MAVIASLNKEVCRIVTALGLKPNEVKDFHLHFPLEDLVTLEATYQRESGVVVEFNGPATLEQITNVGKALDLELRGAFLVVADWLEDNGFGEAASAIRRKEESS